MTSYRDNTTVTIHDNPLQPVSSDQDHRGQSEEIEIIKVDDGVEDQEITMSEIIETCEAAIADTRVLNNDGSGDNSWWTGNPQPDESLSAFQPAATSGVGEETLGVRMSQLEQEIERLACVLKTKENEWNTILRFKKLKELLLVQLKRQGDVEKVEGLIKTKNDLLTLAKASLHDILQSKQSITEVETATRAFTASITEEIDKLEMEIRGKLVSRLPYNRDVNLPKSSPRLAAALNGSIVDSDEGGKRKAESPLASPVIKKSPVTGSLLDAVSFSYSDVLKALSKIAEVESRSSSGGKDIKPIPAPVPVTVIVPTSATNSPVSRTRSRAKAKVGTMQNKNIVGTKSSMTLASLLSSTTAAKTAGIHPVVSNLPVSQSNVSSNGNIQLQIGDTNETVDIPREMIDNNVQNTDGQHMILTPRLCQGCNRKQAIFVCAGCENQWYCDRDCQIAAWTNHGIHCASNAVAQ